MKKILNEQSPSSADCDMLQSVMDPNMYQMVCDVQCTGDTGGFGNNIALLNIASCCECSEPEYEPTPGEEGPCRKIMDTIIPNDYNSTGQEWCKKNCKDANSIVMIAYGNDQLNGCKCCGNLDQVGPVAPQVDVHANGLTPANVYICESGTEFNYQNWDQMGNSTIPGALSPNSENWCMYVHQQDFSELNPNYSNFYMIDNYHYSFQQSCCTPVMQQSDYQLDIAPEWEVNNPDNPDTVNESLIRESLVKRFKKLANIKKRK